MMKSEFISEPQKQFFLKQKTIFAWSKDSGIPYASLHGFFNMERYLTVSNLAKLCDTAGISIDEFLKIGSGKSLVKSK